ncbi:GDP-mannose 4,6-dehydratase [Nitrosopumilus sp. K4]|uniref:NAD-dependent epimerase/dehydratase family protein n=1 Tax=Nitrosopumilus sp. K4 TaxID=2795383 RepID=UPI001BA7963E|nr:GDP-mannose 4,6-dehydratase [Nitrosopumilus sp. K4]QUC64793.1 GDP-mannose 4,6-dehydratase [Nitrosopumilus sp. K4]
MSELEKKNEITGVSSARNKNQKIVQIKNDILKINPSVMNKKFSDIIHLAALTDVEMCQKDPVKCFAINIEGTKNMLDIARKCDSKFVFMSTSHVYGVPNTTPIKEENPTRGLSVYAQSKIGGEVLCKHYANNYGMDVSVIRLFSVYGPSSPKHIVTTKIISQILDKKNIILGNIRPKRDFVFIEDVINAIKIVLEKNHGFNIYNVGSGKSYSIKEVVQILQKISGVETKIISSSSKKRKNEINNMVADIHKIKKIGWKPNTSLYEGLALTYNWFKNKKN